MCHLGVVSILDLLSGNPFEKALGRSLSTFDSPGQQKIKLTVFPKYKAAARQIW